MKQRNPTLWWGFKLSYSFSMCPQWTFPLRGKDKAEDGYRCSWQKHVGLKQHKASTTDAFFCCCCWTMRGTYLRVALVGTFLQTELTQIQLVKKVPSKSFSRGKQVSTKKRLNFSNYENLCVGKYNLSFEGRIVCDILLRYSPHFSQKMYRLESKKRPICLKLKKKYFLKE